MRIISTLFLCTLSACTTVVFAPLPTPAADAGLVGDGFVAPDAWVDTDAGFVVVPFENDAAQTTSDAATTTPGADAWTPPTVSCDADELLDAPAGRCWSYNVTDGVCPAGREVGWWTTTAEQARVQTLMTSLTTNTLVNTALFRGSSGNWLWLNHTAVPTSVTWVSPHPLSTDRHAALSPTGMQADSFALAAGGGTLCVRPAR